MRLCIPVDYVYESIPTFPSQFKPSKRDIQKMTEYFGKGSNPKTLANTVKDAEKALSRYYISVSTGWKACEDSFYNRCIELGLDKSYIDEVRDKALKDKSINIGDTSSANNTTSSRKTIQATPNTKSSSSSISKSNNRKTIDADSGFIITGKGNTPFS